MDIDIQKELAGKNPARVAPQIRRNVKIQKQCVQMHLIMTLFFLALASARLIFPSMPFWVALFALIALGVAHGILYVIVICLTQWTPRKGITYLTAIVSTVLTLIGYVFSPSGSDAWMVSSPIGSSRYWRSGKKRLHTLSPSFPMSYYLT